MDFEPVIGIETHVQLETRSKLFCGCPTASGRPPNTHVCPVCLGLPGSLPVINREALTLAIRAALALNCRIAPRTKFDRKNYFYPDLPKNYQISQYDLPLATDGFLETGTRRINIQRVHLEEDAGKLVHEGEGDHSRIDLNRTGVPLIEIVTRPDLRGPEETVTYLAGLKQTMQYIGVSDCDMEKGELRCDINLSVRPKGSTKLGTKTEIKNLNSFRFAADAIRFEFQRQVEEIRAGRSIVQETRTWDTDKKATFAMRTKEEVHDYRYFPEPDLPPLTISEDEIDRIRTSLPELAPARSRRLREKYSLSEHDAGVLVADRDVAEFYEELARLGTDPKTAANWVVNEILKILNDLQCPIGDLKVAPKGLADLIAMVERQEITSLSAKEALAQMARDGQDAAETVRSMGLARVSDSEELERILDEAIARNPKAASDLKRGKESTQKFFIGQVMKATRGKADVKTVLELLKKKFAS
jgi:aspartyl-tRNA(Asn)/glutamyl-tRNA(Gln) amidotransferase subunit B